MSLFHLAPFLRALAALPSYRAGSFRSWLFTIAHNVITDALRRRRPGKGVPSWKQWWGHIL